MHTKGSLSGIRKIQLSQLVVVIVVWQLAAILISVYDHLVMQSGSVTIREDIYSFPAYLGFNMLGALLGSLIAGPVIIFWINEKFIERPYGWSILAVTFFFVTMTSAIIMIVGVFYIPSVTGLSIGEEGFAAYYFDYIFDIYQLKKLLVWAVILSLTELGLQLDRKFGHGILWKIILGNYHSPKEEYRIFMFADLDSSTTIAESVGDEKYHMLLREFFADITNAIINNHGSIYQYVGDQVIVSWTIDKSNTTAHCINCFFDMRKSISVKRDVYMRKYGIVPAFKAGIHAGKVIAGEIGIIKRDITYSGDVLNTTSRIQGKCGDLDQPLLVSDELLKRIFLKPPFTSHFIGTIKLKGKKNEVGLNAVSMDDLAVLSYN